MRKVISLLVIMVFVFTMTSVAIAAESNFKKASKDAARYSGNVVTGSVNTVGEAVYGTTETAISPIKAFWRNLIGKGKPQEIVTSPINRGGETVRDAAVNTGKTVTGRKR